MSTLKFNLVQNGDVRNLTVLAAGEFLVADNNHPNFDAIVAKVLADDETVVDLFNTGKVVNDRFQALTDRAWVSGNQVFFDGDPVHDVITDHILRFLDDQEDFYPLVAFLDLVKQNPQDHSRDNLYRWLAAAKGFTIDDEGWILGYKGVSKNPDGTYRSISSGKAYVNGEEHTVGQVPQDFGDTVSFPRSEVQHDPAVGCSVGLHVGTWEYASGFSQGAVLLVRVNPRDVVSVPVDSSDQKMRVCSYEVLDEVTSPVDSAVWLSTPVPEVEDDTIGPKFTVGVDDPGYYEPQADPDDDDDDDVALWGDPYAGLL